MGSITAVIRQLGYPSESTLYRWYERRKAGLENKHGHTADVSENTEYRCNTSEHPWHPFKEFKYEVLHRCFELGEDVEYVSREIGYSCMSIYVWRRNCLKHGMVGLMAKRKNVSREPLSQNHMFPQSEEMEALRTQAQNLQFEVDVLQETGKILLRYQELVLTAPFTKCTTMPQGYLTVGSRCFLPFTKELLIYSLTPDCVSDLG